MKKFEFTMEKMLSFKNQMLSKEKLTLADMRKKLAVMNDEIAKLSAEYKLCNDDLNAKISKGLSPDEIRMKKNYLTLLTDKIKKMRISAQAMEAMVEAQVQNVVKATQDVTTLDKLKEKQYEEYRYLENKEQEILVEEFVSNGTIAGEM